MTASEFAFLAMGLILGLASGAALVELVRARPPAREVRLTVAQDAVPRRRSATLSDDAFTASAAEPARGGPADRRSGTSMLPTGAAERRTFVQGGGEAAEGGMPAAIGTEGVGEGVASEPRPGRVVEPAFRLAGPGAPGPGVPGSRPDLVGVPVESEVDPMLAALRATAAASAVSAMRSTAPSARMSTAAAESTGSAGPSGIAGPSGSAGPSAQGASDSTAPPPSSGPPPPSPEPGAGASSAPPASAPPKPADAPRAAPSGPCADERRLADERCVLAARAREQANAAEDALRVAQRAYDDHEARGDEAALAADPRAIRRAKDEAQARFRARRGAALTTDEVESAAREWLLEVNRINGEAREAAATLARERQAAREIGARLERTSLEADAARIAAETAEAACIAARQAVADCQERAAGAAAVPAAGPTQAAPSPTAPSATAPSPAAPVEPLPAEQPLVAALAAGTAPRVFRLLRGDRATMSDLVAALAGDDPEERRRWQLGLSDLVDAILADAIEASALDFPHDHPFWGPFTIEQDRDIAAALSSLGYRFDGLGGWMDGRVPSQRDLSLALGYAGLDPMRMRHWPDEHEMTELYREVAVAGDEHLARSAGGLTLGELVTMLGRRAEGLAEIWNDWGRLRPLLLEED